MNKKIIYALILTSIFVMSIASVCIQPVAGANWKFGVPKEAKGMKLQGEVTVYDKDKWGECVGLDVDDTVNEWFGGEGTGANDVGAKSQSEITDWEKADIWFLGDHLLWAEVGSNPYGLITYWDAIQFGHDTQTEDMVGLLFALAIAIDLAGGDVDYDPTTLPGSEPFDSWITAILSSIIPLYAVQYSNQDVSKIYSKTYEGIYLERDKWDFALDLESNPDTDGELVPFIEDPHNIYDSFLYFESLIQTLLNQMNGASASAYGLYNVGGAVPKINGNANEPLVDGGLAGLVAAGMLPAKYGDTDIICQTIYGTPALISAYFAAKVPDRKEYVNLLLRQGLPAMQPVDKWWEKVLDDFRIDGDGIWGKAGNQHQGGIKQDGLTITVDYEWVDGVMNDWWWGPEQREDYSVSYVYGDTGGQSSVIFEGSGVFYQTESIAPTIPGFEISILLAAAAISALGLIYVIIRKRKM